MHLGDLNSGGKNSAGGTNRSYFCILRLGLSTTIFRYFAEVSRPFLDFDVGRNRCRQQHVSIIQNIDRKNE
jgi:hypothetical protein